MPPIGDTIAPAMLVVALAGIVAGLLARRIAGWAALALVALFGFSLLVPSPRETAEAAELHLHWFPATLLVLGLPAIGVATLVGYGTRALVRRLRIRDGGLVE